MAFDRCPDRDDDGRAVAGNERALGWILAARPSQLAMDGAGGSDAALSPLAREVIAWNRARPEIMALNRRVLANQAARGRGRSGAYDSSSGLNGGTSDLLNGRGEPVARAQYRFEGARSSQYWGFAHRKSPMVIFSISGRFCRRRRSGCSRCNCRSGRLGTRRGFVMQLYQRLRESGKHDQFMQSLGQMIEQEHGGGENGDNGLQGGTSQRYPGGPASSHNDTFNRLSDGGMLNPPRNGDARSGNRSGRRLSGDRRPPAMDARAVGTFADRFPNVVTFERPIGNERIGEVGAAVLFQLAELGLGLGQCLAAVAQIFMGSITALLERLPTPPAPRSSARRGTGKGIDHRDRGEPAPPRPAHL
jgi:hypothetical protein